MIIRNSIRLHELTLPYDLPANTAIPDDLREDFVPIRHITCSKRLTMPITKKDILTRARFDNTIDLSRPSWQLVGGHQLDDAI